MKSALLTFLGIGLPLVLMMVLWRFLSAPLPETSGHHAAPQPVSTTHHVNREALGEALRSMPANNDRAVDRPQPAAGSLLDTFDNWLDAWDRAARRNPEYQRAAAADLLRTHNYDDALTAFDRLLVREPNDPMLMTGKAMALTSLGRDDDALPLLENLARKTPQNVSAQFNYAAALMRAGEHPAALAALHRVVQLEPRHARALFNMAVLLQAMNRPAEALTAWRLLTDSTATTTRAATTRPATTQLAGDEAPNSSPAPYMVLSDTMLADAWSHRGELALQLKHPEEAEKCFLQTAQLEPRSGQAWCNVGIARAGQSRRSDALTALSIALQLDPNCVPALNQTAYLQAANYRDLGDPACGRVVVDCCRRSLRLRPNQPNIAALERAAQAFDPNTQ